jgi:hypothetical protein
MLFWLVLGDALALPTTAAFGEDAHSCTAFCYTNGKFFGVEFSEHACVCVVDPQATVDIDEKSRAGCSSFCISNGGAFTFALNGANGDCQCIEKPKMGFGGCPKDEIPRPTPDGKLVCECPWGFERDGKGHCVCVDVNITGQSRAVFAWLGAGFACMTEKTCKAAGLGWNDKTRRCQEEFKIELDFAGIASKGRAQSKYGGDHYYKAVPASRRKVE